MRRELDERLRARRAPRPAEARKKAVINVAAVHMADVLKQLVRPIALASATAAWPGAALLHAPLHLQRHCYRRSRRRRGNSTGVSRLQQRPRSVGIVARARVLGERDGEIGMPLLAVPLHAHQRRATAVELRSAALAQRRLGDGADTPAETPLPAVDDPKTHQRREIWRLESQRRLERRRGENIAVRHRHRHRHQHGSTRRGISF